MLNNTARQMVYDYIPFLHKAIKYITDTLNKFNLTYLVPSLLHNITKMNCEEFGKLICQDIDANCATARNLMALSVAMKCSDIEILKKYNELYPHLLNGKIMPKPATKEDELDIVEEAQQILIQECEQYVEKILLGIDSNDFENVS